MPIRITLRTAWRALARNLTRSVLTVLGVVIGVATVIAMVSVGQGADASVQAQIASLGQNIVMVVPGATTAGGVRSGYGAASTLTVPDARAIERDCPSVAGVTYLKRDVVQVTYGNQNWSTGIQGSPPSYLNVRDWGWTPVASSRPPKRTVRPRSPSSGAPSSTGCSPPGRIRSARPSGCATWRFV